VTINGLSLKKAEVEVDVCNYDFQALNRFKIPLKPEFENDESINYGGCETFYCYENILVLLLNHRNLLFYNLTTGNEIKNHLIDELSDIPYDEDELVRLKVLDDKILAIQKRSIDLFDLHTGNLIKSFKPDARLYG